MGKSVSAVNQATCKGHAKIQKAYFVLRCREWYPVVVTRTLMTDSSLLCRVQKSWLCHRTPLPGHLSLSSCWPAGPCQGTAGPHQPLSYSLWEYSHAYFISTLFHFPPKPCPHPVLPFSLARNLHFLMKMRTGNSRESGQRKGLRLTLRTSSTSIWLMSKWLISILLREGEQLRASSVSLGDRFASACLLSHVWHCTAPWTVAFQAPLSVEFSRQEHWSGLPCPPPGDLPNPGTKSTSLPCSSLAGRFFTTSAAWKAQSTLESNTSPK